MLESVTLTNVRSHKMATFNFGQLTVIVGPNGAGKTNILEAISLASTTRSWRTKSDLEVVAWNEPFARIEADKVAVVITRQPFRKQFLISGIKRSAKEVVGVVKTVLFEPEDLQIIYGSPLFRRHFLNVVLSQSDYQYGAALITYRQVITQRNKLLKRIQEGRSQIEELNFWDAELVRLSQIIWSVRSSFITLAKGKLIEHYQDLSGEKVEIGLRHEQHPADPDKLEEEIVAVREREILLGQTTRGPHRDDLIITMDGLPAVTRASRGEVRSLTFALKMVELDYLTQTAANQASKSPSDDVVLLLDDVMSELDAKRRQRLVEVTEHVQTIITTTDLDDIPPELQQRAAVIELDK